MTDMDDMTRLLEAIKKQAEEDPNHPAVRAAKAALWVNKMPDTESDKEMGAVVALVLKKCGIENLPDVLCFALKYLHTNKELPPGSLAVVCPEDGKVFWTDKFATAEEDDLDSITGITPDKGRMN